MELPDLFVMVFTWSANWDHVKTMSDGTKSVEKQMWDPLKVLHKYEMARETMIASRRVADKVADGVSVTDSGKSVRRLPDIPSGSGDSSGFNFTE